MEKIHVSEAEYEWLTQKLEEELQEMPKLEALMKRESPWADD